ncbi:MAG: hypothetical protein AAF678_12345 [Pseudomonadota bacterium]
MPTKPDIKKVLASIADAGMTIGLVQILPDGTLNVYPEGQAPAAPAENTPEPYDVWRDRHGQKSA